MATWNGSTETGILRKTNQTENFDDLLVFGYACKLFRDDEKALFIDQGKHLIPWMGDDTLKIDSNESLNIILESISENQDQDSNSHYLHPSLVSSSTAEPAGTTAKSIPQIPYKPSVNCAYSQLVNRIQGNQAENQETQKIPEYEQMTYEQQQYYQYYYVQQYLEYYKQLALHYQGQAGNPGQFVPPADFQNLDPTLQHYIQQMAYTQYLQQFQQSNNSYAQIVSNVNKETNPYIANVPQLPQLPETVKNQEDERTVTIVGEKKKVEVNKPLLSLAAYGSGSDSDSDDSTESDDREVRTVTKVESTAAPTDETKIVIDKMALYVSKNGEQFEDIVKAKNDPRFEFLQSSHKFYKYYKETLKRFMDENNKNGQEKQETNKEKEVVKKPPKEKKERKVIAPVSFSIKKAKEELPKEIKSALPIEESSDEEEQASSENTETQKSPTPAAPHLLKNILWRIGDVQKPVIPPIQVQENASKNEEPKHEKIVSKNEEPKHEKIVSKNEEPKHEKHVSKNDQIGKKIVSINEDPILEMMEFLDGVEKQGAKKAEDKVKDKLAAVRDKLSVVATKDKALQLERKRKAAAFLKLKSAETNHQPEERTPERTEKDRTEKERTEKDITEKERTEKEKTPLRRDSDCIEVIELDSEDSPPKKKKHKKDKYKDRDESRSRSRDRDHKKEKKKHKNRDKRRSDSDDEEDENKKRKKKRKKSHKRSYESKSKKKSKKRHKKSESESSNSSDSSS
uniref:Protein suppressor of white apricot-like n=1 Tax=Diabrotica virgifera virgifera TaxID=50390 RepID=A0A6P7FMQ2_DIAVI